MVIFLFILHLSGGHFVLFAGDWHSGNLWFKKGEEGNDELSDVLAIDWQAAHVGPPGIERSQTTPMMTTGRENQLKIVSHVLPLYYQKLVELAPCGSEMQS